MATHSSVLAWRIPGTKEPGRLPSVGWHRVGHDWSDLAVAAAASPLSWWCHPTISSSVILFSSRLQSFPASGSFQMSQFFASGGQSVGVSVSTSVLPMKTQDWFLLGWTGLISFLSKGFSRVFSNTTVQKHQLFGAQPSLWSNSPMHTWWLLGKLSFDIWTFVGKVMSLPFNTLSRWVIAFLPRSKRLSLSWLQSQSAVVLKPHK